MTDDTKSRREVADEVVGILIEQGLAEPFLAEIESVIRALHRAYADGRIDETTMRLATASLRSQLDSFKRGFMRHKERHL